MTQALFLILLSYVVGSIPTGYWIGRLKGIDIRTQGSGNIGATNVFRTLGKGIGVGCLGVDIFKGWFAAGVIAGWAWYPGSGLTWMDTQLLHGVAAILGHSYTCFLKFKGGKGVATSAGVLLAVIPKALLVAILVWVIVVALRRMVSLGSLLSANLLPPLVILFYRTHPDFLKLIWVCVALAILVTYRHRTNIQRLLKGEEHKIF
jgi:acyl phosphate:glycerol-3-phosphate acyltransferase